MGRETSRHESAAADAHLIDMGRDEMNLAEFPLATLADRAPSGTKTLVFEDRIWDRGQRQDRIRRLTITASDKYGLPTATDDEVILGLVQVTKATGFAERQVRFSRYQLIGLLGWRDEGRSYQRLETSLKRWLGVTLYYENAWWDRTARRWVDAHCHLLEELVLYHRPRKKLSASATVHDKPRSSFTWNETVFRSFQAGFLKRLDLALYRCLKLAAAKRMYRFLDKRFHHAGTQRFNLRVFACEHVGLSRRYDSAQLKRRLAPAIAELERAGFLANLPVSEQYRRLRRGEWEVTFVHNPELRKSRRSNTPRSDVESHLVDRGVTVAVATRLVREHPAEMIEAKIGVFDAMRMVNDRRISQNPAGYLVQSIRDDYVPPAGMGGRACRHTSERTTAAASPAKRRVVSKPRAKREMFHVETSRAIEHLSSMSVPEREALEASAMAQAHRVLAEGYRRALAAGKAEVADQYRQVIVEQYLRDVIDPKQYAAQISVTQASV